MNLDKYDAITRREIEVFLERKDAESDKLKGQIAKDLRRVGGEDGLSPVARQPKEIGDTR